jgi:hypothetical protein
MNSAMLKTFLASLVRHGLTAAGAALVTDGYMTSGDTQAFVGGGMVVAGVAWSWWQKVGQQKVVALLQPTAQGAQSKPGA